MNTKGDDNPPRPSRPPLYCELEEQLKALSEENRKLRAELAESRQKNKKFVNDSLLLYRNIESLLVENDQVGK